MKCIAEVEFAQMPVIMSWIASDPFPIHRQRLSMQNSVMMVAQVVYRGDA